MTSTEKFMPWVDKYRPSKLTNIIQQKEVTKVLTNTLKTGNLPHLLFFGPSGTGKTSTILAFARELFGSKFSERVIELNASDDRGINVVREKIKTFARTSVGTADPDYPSPEYKIVILDEADAMTTEAQAALRHIIESTSTITRFCFICNYIDKIIEPIASRCVKFRFKSIDPDIMKDRLRFIADRENIKISDDALLTIAKLSNGDARRGIHTLQNIRYLNKKNIKISSENVTYLMGDIETKKIEEIIKTCKTKKIDDVIDLANAVKREAYPIQRLLYKIQEHILSEPDIDDDTKSKILIDIANSEALLLDGASEYVQILHIFMKINKYCL